MNSPKRRKRDDASTDSPDEAKGPASRKRPRKSRAQDSSRSRKGSPRTSRSSSNSSSKRSRPYSRSASPKKTSSKTERSDSKQDDSPPKKRSSSNRRPRNFSRSMKGKPPRRDADVPKAMLQAITKPMRLNRFIAKAGVASRRKADELIAEGAIKVDGVVVTQLGTTVEPGQAVTFRGRLLTPRPFHYVLMNKPKNVITTTSDEKDRRTVMDLVEDDELQKAGLYPVGRLDRNTLGLLLLTNDGDLANRLMHPRYEVDKLYRIRTAERVKPHELQQLAEGVTLDDGPAKADQVSYLEGTTHNEIGMLIHEGRNRQVRRMMEALGHEVRELERVGYAGMTAKNLRRGKWRRLDEREVRKLRRQVGLK
ncbi:MAG: pseudouridine synthase [Bacteroidota bacterium]